jgi:hypothetical protein
MVDVVSSRFPDIPGQTKATEWLRLPPLDMWVSGGKLSTFNSLQHVWPAKILLRKDLAVDSWKQMS